MDKSYVLVERTYEPTTLSVPILIIAIILGAFAFTIMYYGSKHLDSEVANIASIPFLLLMAVLIRPWLWYIMGISQGDAKFNEIPISQVQQYVHVDKSKVVIDELPEEYFYKDKSDSTKPEHVGRRIFEFKNDSLYEKVTLVDENGNSFRLNDDDIKFLEERGANNG